MRRFLTTLALGATLAVPVVIKADDHHDKNRYYDRNSRDWHEWNEREERAYRRYLQENRQRELAWERANAKQQRAYWKWRHKHPDAVVYGDRR